MEEEIKILEKLEYISYGNKEDVEALRILEGDSEIETTKIIKKLITKYKEQEKIIELLAKDIAENDIDEDICKKVGKNPFCDEYGEESKCVECVIAFYRKKARDNNE